MEFIKEEINHIIENEEAFHEYLKSEAAADFPYFRNQKELKQLIEFYNNDDERISHIGGSFGTFKTKLVEISTKLLSSDVLIFNFKCFESTTLDDLFLSLFNDLKNFRQEKKITFTKIETDSLSKKINQYLSHINTPSVFVFDSFENLEIKNKEEILNFIEHLLDKNKFKVLIISNEEYNAQIKMEPFTKEDVEGYLKALSIDTPSKSVEKLFQQTEGNTNYVEISANMILTLNISLQNLLEEFKAKKTSYQDFILQKLVSFVPDKYKKPMSILALIKSGLTRDFLLGAEFFTKEQLNYLIEKEVLSEENGYIFLKSYVKEYIKNLTSHFETLKIHQYLKNLYESQLPLKPTQRVLPMSRTTMRDQIAYHDSFLIKEQPKDKIDTAYLGYISANLTEWTMDDIKKEEKKPFLKSSSQKSTNDSDPMVKYKLSQEELALLGLPIDLEIPVRDSSAMSTSVNETVLTFEELFNMAQDEEKNHEYASALENYKKALDKKYDFESKPYFIQILRSCINCSKKLNNIDESIKYLEKIYDYYYENKDTESANFTLLEIAKTYKDSYRFLKAKELYERFINSKLPVSQPVLAYAYIGIAQIEEDSSDLENALKHYKKAFDYTKNIEDNAFLAEAYFKYALILDDNNQTESALSFYEKSTVTNPDINTNDYLSSAYSNIGEIYEEQKDFKTAFKNYRLALKYDSELLNNEGIYYLCVKLAMISEKIKPDLVLNFRLKALWAAKRIQDRFYILNSYLEVANCYDKAKNNEKALKAYIYAREVLIKEEHKKDDLRKIDTRIYDLKKLMRGTLK